MRPSLRPLGLAAASLAAAACASATRALVRPYAVAPTGLEVPEQALRDALVAGRWDEAGRQAGSEKAGGPGDALLRTLYAGTADFYAGRYAQSARAFDRAGQMADERYTKRVSRGALALLTNDRALPYLPGDNERLMAGYYATLAYLHAGDLDGAAVEARRLALALQAADARRDPMDRSLRAALRYLTGAVFEASGEREDADVAYRNAAALGAVVDTGAARRAEADAAMRGTLRGPRARRLAARARAAEPPPGTGEVVALVEGGFVAHRVDDRLSVRLDGRDAASLTETRGGVVVGGRGGRATAGWAPAAGSLGTRLAALLTGDAGLWAGELPAELALADSAPATPAASAAGAARDTAAGAAKGGSTGGAGEWAVEPLQMPAMPEPVGSVRSGGVRSASGRVLAGGGAAGSEGRLPGRTPGRASAPPAAPADASDVHVDGEWGSGRRGRRADRAAEVASVWRGARVFTIAWPAYRRPAWMPRATGVAASAASAGPAGAGAAPASSLGTPVAASDTALGAARGVVARGDLSAAAGGDFRRDRGNLLARLVARAAVRAALADQAGRKHAELGSVVRALGNALEHADTRSWHLLPGEVRVVRLRLPAGEQALSVDVDGRRVPVGTVRVAPGAIRFVSVRLWDAGGYRVTSAGVDAPAVGVAGGAAGTAPGGA